MTGSIAGLASLVSYPALLATGLSPVAANVTNTVALVFNGIGATAGSRLELRGQGHRIRRFALLAGMGGACGGALLLAAPGDTFARVVPVLVGGASLMVLLPPRPSTFDAAESHRARTGVVVFAIGVYGGYFGAAAGVLLLALLLALFNETLARINALKNVVMVAPNAVAALAFAVFGPVHWAAVLPLAVGFFIGGRISPAIVRRLPMRPLRIGIGLAGLGLAAKLAWDAWA
ncbi:UPF0721 transmembrane protein [Nocardiopsis ansamitocini]|uniref:Probable membrane transporter protein n=1 Tax=Nocardiopsis ansamitocini TaxID=1670832 RepID=A0A9W6UK30_9ACTN|nr:UPF0721 transmembrane protein [Nocardiopsis ansamitocini]